jgi:hypothetical protein
MSSDSKKFFEPRPNYAALQELEEKYYHKPTEEEIQDFLLFWNDVYNVWRELYPDKLDMGLLEHKVKIRKLLNGMTRLKVEST